MKDKSKQIIVSTAALVAVAAALYFNTRPGTGSYASPLVVSARPLPDNSSASPAVPAVSPVSSQPAIATTNHPSTPRAASLTFGEKWNDETNEPEFTRFTEWFGRYRSARPGEERAALEAEGRQLATERSSALSSLIRDDPERALALALPFHVRRQLPGSIGALFEESVSGRGSLSVFAALPEPGKEHEVTPVFRTASIGDREYDAFVYGRRLGEPTRWNIPINGIAIGRLLALSANPVRVISAEEAGSIAAAPNEPVCAVSGQSAAIHNTPIAAEVAGEVVRLCGSIHADDLNERLIQVEAAGGRGGGGGGSIAGGDPQASAYTEGTKRLLLIRVDFSDLAGEPFSTGTGTGLISGLNDFYRESSFGRTGFHPHGSGSEVTPTLRMPQTAANYGANNSYTQLRSDARAAATTAGFVLSNYDFDVICFGNVPGWGWAGLGYVGAPGVWLRSYFTTGVAGHELGHNLGLNHANYWDTQGNSIIGAGSSVEYGDVFDTMGSANGGANHFNARYKSYLNWLTSSEVQTIASSGIYRLYAHDDTNATGIRGLKIVRNSGTNYWVEFRQKFTSNKWMMNGAGIRWAGNGNQRSDLLDTTPGSANGKNDSALVVGRTFSDPAYGIHITTLRKAGTSPEALDVVVNLGSFPGNSPPTVAVSANATSVAMGATVTFNASATDPNGDTLAHYWDFGDGNFGTNGAVASKSWSTTGEYLVQCTVTDMKGATASDSIIVTVGTPGTYRISGQVTIGGSPVPGARVYVSSSRMAYTDSDGTYSIVGLPTSSYTVTVSRDGYSFTPSGFSNPVPVGPSASGVNFTASAGFVTVALTSPANGTAFVSPGTVALAANAAAASGNTLSKVEFYEAATKLGQDTTAPYTYNWNNPAPGTYSLTAVATDSGGLMATSAPVSVVISPSAPSISSEPQSNTVAAGANASFSVTASGGGTLTYRWRSNGTNVPGGTSATLSLLNVQATHAGNYSVVVTNGGGAVTSAVATLTVVQSPVITSQPQSQSISAGSAVTLSVTAVGSNPLRYQWLRDGSALADATNNLVQFTPALPSDAGSYSVIISNNAGSTTSSTAILAVDCPVGLSTSNASFTSAGGNGSITLTAHSACSWTVANVPSWIALTSPSSGSGNGSLTFTVAENVSASARTATMDIEGTDLLISQAAPDLTPPSVAITSPSPNFTTSEATLLVSGSASDNVGVELVEYRVGTNAFTAALGTTSWSAMVPLAAGTNVISVRCVDTSGNVSPGVERSFVCVVSGTITVTINGQGEVRGATNGQRLQIGRAYRLTAAPSPGYAFSNWTGTVSHSDLDLDFMMTSNLQVTANFVPNPFAASKGLFSGLFYETNEVHHERAGYFTMALTDKGSYSASILTRGLKLKAKGKLDITGRGTNQMVAPNGTTYTVSWAVALDGSDQVSGVVSSGGWTAPLVGDRLVFDAKTNPASAAGRYTFVVLGNPRQANAPGGDSYGTVSVDTRGTARLAGYLADHTRLVSRSPLSKSGNWPVYASLYKGAGAILGWVAFRDRPTTDLDGVLSWTRPGVPGAAIYPQGFTSEAALIGSRFQTVISGGNSLPDIENPIVRWDGGNLPQSFTNVVSASGASILNLSPNGLTLKISPATGAFGGVVARPDSGERFPFRGVIVQKARFGSGYFIGTNETGQVVVENRP